MENDREEFAHQLAVTERGEAAGWIVGADGPWWMPLFVAVYAGVLALSVGYLEGWVGSLVRVALILSVLAVLWVMRARRGVYPTGSAPREFRGLNLVLVCGVILVASLAGLVGWAWAPWAGALVAAVGAYAFTALYGQLYAAAADRARARLA